MQEEEQPPTHPLYYVSLVSIVILINLMLVFGTWACYKLIWRFIDLTHIELFDAFIFVCIFLTLDYAKQLIFELFFGVE